MGAAGSQFVTCVTFIVDGAQIEFKHNSFTGSYQLRHRGKIVMSKSVPVDMGNTFRFELDDGRTLKIRSYSVWYKPGFFNHKFFAGPEEIPKDALNFGDLPVSKRTSRMGSIDLGVSAITDKKEEPTEAST